jgi:hypothetical protein
MLRYFEDFFHGEVLRRLQFPALSAPNHGLSFLAVRTELLQAIIYAIK